jgi:hypothetical protein
MRPFEKAHRSVRKPAPTFQHDALSRAFALCLLREKAAFSPALTPAKT